MKNIRFRFIFIFIFFAFTFFLNCNNGKVITINGKIGNKFFHSSTQNYDKEMKQEILDNIEVYLQQSKKLDEYYFLINKNKHEKADKFLKSDSSLENRNDFGLAYMYATAKLFENKLLFKPMIQCNGLTESHLISISLEQLKNLKPHMNKTEVELKIIEVGKMEMDQTKLYKLQNFKLKK